MATDYDTIAADYKQAKRQTWRTVIESFTLMELAGNVSGKAVVDLACGDGYYTRQLRRQGAAKVVGVDLSEGMIALARVEEASQPLGIEYLVQDGMNLDLEADYDLVVAAYLLNYARDRHELAAMCRGIARCLKPGGRFVAVNSNSDQDWAGLPSYRPYGFEKSAPRELREGAPVIWTFHVADGSFEVENYHLDRATHERAFYSAGLGHVRWHRPRLAPAAGARPDRDFWNDFLAHPPVIFIECVKDDLDTRRTGG